MRAPALPPPPVREAAATPNGRLRRWWRRQSPARQDNFATLAPLLSVLLFLAAIILAFWYLRNEELEREQEAVQRDTEVAQQQIRLHLIENQEQMVRIARELVAHETNRKEFLLQAAAFSRERPEIVSMSWMDARRVRKATHASGAASIEGEDDPSFAAAGRRTETADAFAAAQQSRQPVYSKPFIDLDANPAMQLHVPLIDHGTFSGMLVTEYSIERLLRYLVPKALADRHAVRLVDAAGHTLAGTVALMPGQKSRRASIVHAVPLAPAGNGILLVGEGYRTSIGLISNTLFWMVALLSVLTLWMLVGTWLHMRRRLQMQKKLVSEANFRRAMENSMLTGMRAMDMDGRITYVNPAFCAMTGFSEAELLYRRPPFPHWPPDRYEENSRLLQQELRGQSPAGGIEVKVLRKDGSLFDARMYVSPLIDPKDQQTGWMTSMTNITEAKRIRDQLTASHERFTTVLEGLDAAVSVLSVQQGELLFANRSYRLWFGISAQAHALLAGEDDESSADAGDADAVDSLSGIPTDGVADSPSVGSREVYIDPLQKWFDVRARYLQWTDGRLAQMLIATDITARRDAEALAASQAEKAQVTSRLVAMGEMASSVAHELNQPLTAIANYCNGIVSRVNSDAIGKAELLSALQKTSRQAQRAGEIIRRIREFVKRSEPQRQHAQAKTIIDDAVELAGIELRRRNVAIRTYVAQRLPPLMVDPILIEQVLLNLLKNAAEAIDAARLPPARRRIELRVVPKHTDEEGEVIEFSVTDLGPGLPNEVIARLYEAFFSTKAEGLGIGLSLCRTIIESHRGRIKAQNLYNGAAVSGCCFVFTLPVDTSPIEASAATLS